MALYGTVPPFQDPGIPIDFVPPSLHSFAKVKSPSSLVRDLLKASLCLERRRQVAHLRGPHGAAHFECWVKIFSDLRIIGQSFTLWLCQT